MLLCSGTTLAKRNPSSWCWETCSPCPGYFDRSAIEQVPGVCFLTRCPLTDPGTHPHLSAQCVPASVRSVDSRREWLSGELRSSHAACGEPCAGRADDGNRRGEGGLEVRWGWVGRSASVLNAKISLCHALLLAERWRDCTSPATDCPNKAQAEKIYRQRKRERWKRRGKLMHRGA